MLIINNESKFIRFTLKKNYSKTHLSIIFWIFDYPFNKNIFKIFPENMINLSIDRFYFLDSLQNKSILSNQFKLTIIH